MARSQGQHRPLPKPTRSEWIGGLVGILLVGLGSGLAEKTGIGWFWLVFLAGIALTYATLGRVGYARIDAIRSRPPQ